MNLKIIIITFCSLLLAACSGTNNELSRADQLMESAPDSALHVLQRIKTSNLTNTSNRALYALLMSQALDKNDIKIESDSLIRIATDYYTDKEPMRAAYTWFYMARCANNRGDAKTQANALLKAQEFAEETKNYKLRGLVYGEKGTMYGTQNQFDSSIYYTKKAYQSFIKIGDYRNSVICLINIGYKYLYTSSPQNSISYYLEANRLAGLCKDTILVSTIYRHLGIAYFQQKKYQRALGYYYKAPLTHLPIYDCNKWYLLANVYIKTNNFDSARFYLRRVNQPFEMAPDYYRLWQILYEHEGNLAKSLYYSKRATAATDSLYKRKLDISFAGMERKYKFQSLQVANQSLVIKDKQNNILVLSGLIILSFGIITVLFWRYKVKNQQLKTQSKLAGQEKKLLEKEMVNNKLLEQQLKMQNILLLNVEQYRKNSIKRPDNARLIINPVQNDTFYEELIACMDLEYRDISKRLVLRIPELTERDILICCLLLANFDTGMIASILDVKIESINKHRYRLRTKLGLSNSDSLTDYLRNF